MTITATTSVHYENFLRYKAKVEAEPQPFTASQQRTPLEYLPYAFYPHTPEGRTPDPSPAPALLTPEQLAAAFRDAAPLHGDRRVERTVTLHEGGDGTTAAVLSVMHNKDSKTFIASVKIVRHEAAKGDSMFSVTTWIPFEKTHNRRLPSIPVARYSAKALEAADQENLDMLAAEPDWLATLDLGPYNGSL